MHEERVIVVDAENKVTGSVPRSEMRQKNLIHRASYILVFNGKNELFVQKRTTRKDIYPGYYDIAAGGVVVEGESYEESAQRELKEELGVQATLRPLFDNYYNDVQNKVWGRIFSCVHDGPFSLQAAEVESGAFMTLAEILDHSEREPYTPDGLFILSRLLSRHTI